MCTIQFRELFIARQYQNLLWTQIKFYHGLSSGLSSRSLKHPLDEVILSTKFGRVRCRKKKEGARSHCPVRYVSRGTSSKRSEYNASSCRTLDVGGGAKVPITIRKFERSTIYMNRVRNATSSRPDDVSHVSAVSARDQEIRTARVRRRSGAPNVMRRWSAR